MYKFKGQWINLFVAFFRGVEIVHSIGSCSFRANTFKEAMLTYGHDSKMGLLNEKHLP